MTDKTIFCAGGGNDAGRNRTEIIQPDDLHHKAICPDCSPGGKGDVSAIPVQGIPRQAERPHPSAAKPGRVQRGDQLERQTWIETLSMNNHIDENESRFYIEAYIRKLQNEGIARKSVSDAQKHFANWLRIELKRARDEQSGIHQKPNSKTKQERYAEFAEAIAAKLAAGDTVSLQDGGESALPY